MNFVEKIRLYNLVNLLLIYKNLTSEFVRCLSSATSGSQKKMVLTFFDYFAKLVKHFGWHPKSEKWTLLSKSCTIFWLRPIISFDDLCDVCANEMKIVLAWLSYFVKLRSTMLFNYNHSWIWFTSYLYRAPHVELYNRIGTRWWNLTKTADNFRVEMSNKFPRSEGQSVRFLWRLYHRYNM